ncbi:MAG: tyrosine-type recombinase/integrase [Candidatus Saliniplasma sp.]
MRGNNRSSSNSLPKYLKESEIKNMLERANRNRKRDYLILLTLFRTGMRNSELVNLKKKDISFSEGHITVRKGKSEKDRIIPLDTHLKDLLDVYAGEKGKDERIFDVTTRTVRNIVKRYSEEEWVHPHTFRHSFAVKCLKDEMNLVSLQKILGHSSLETTQIYLDLIGEDVKKDFEKVEW